MVTSAKHLIHIISFNPPNNTDVKIVQLALEMPMLGPGTYFENQTLSFLFLSFVSELHFAPS